MSEAIWTDGSGRRVTVTIHRERQYSYMIQPGDCWPLGWLRPFSSVGNMSCCFWQDKGKRLQKQIKKLGPFQQSSMLKKVFKIRPYIFLSYSFYYLFWRKRGVNMLVSKQAVTWWTDKLQLFKPISRKWIFHLKKPSLKNTVPALRHGGRSIIVWRRFAASRRAKLL